jgi:CDP-paratose 2-epimerase
MLEDRLCKGVRWRYDERNRRGDHICYVSNLQKLRSHFPGWRITRDLDSIVDEMIESELAKARTSRGDERTSILTRELAASGRA